MKVPESIKTVFAAIRRQVTGAPLMSWLFGVLVAVALEYVVGYPLARALGLPKVPALFGLTLMLKQPLLIPSALLYTTIIYVLPVGLIAKFSDVLGNAIAARLLKLPFVVTVMVHLGMLYLVFHLWTGVSDYRLVTLKFMLIAILLTLSLNLINGYMGEFSCSHPGFMALGAYTASMFTIGLFTDNRLLGEAVFHSPLLGYALFPLMLLIGGAVASFGALIIAIPSFKTRGDYLAIISLAFLFIVKSLIENLEFMGGPRGLSGQPDWATLPMVFSITVAGVWIMNNFVTSTMGKGLNAVRDDESAAEAMTVDTRAVKMRCFLFGAFWAGVAGGLYAHVIRYISPADFGLTKLAEILAMVYFGGLNSIWGSIVGAVGISALSEVLRPLQMLKWLCIPLLLILVMIYRPRGLVSFKEFNLRKMLSPRRTKV
ncbi:MAG: branched-chain amino acid ABC transporter permease [Proteobacteria bacterium]|nr:branched-chain amino acid ABC transporter permease [Pseudomonadota bacterium]MBU1610990.1 branched-chain amino acid ABC transporter permease [Pseudomonadota bacterium]